MENIITDNLWIILIGLILISLPYLYFIIKSRKKEREQRLSFQDFTASGNVVLDKVQKWRNHYILGLDSKKNVLIYYKMGHFPSEVTVNLEEVDHTSLDIHYEENRDGFKRINKPEYFNILLHFKDPKRAVKSILIYDKKEIVGLVDELSIAQYWVQTINTHLRTRPQLKLAM